MNIVFFGLSITSSWGNGHATTYRALIRELTRRGHDVTFFERDMPWYAETRDLHPLACTARVILYHSLDDLEPMADLIRNADAVIIGSYVPEGIEVCEWVLPLANGITAFYDIDTPVTIASMQRGDCDYLRPGLISRFHLYLSFAGGETLTRLEREYGSPRARAFYCSVDPSHYFYEPLPERRLLGYLGTFSEDRQPGLNRLMLEPARVLAHERFIVAGPQFPHDIAWPHNVEHIQHLPPDDHRSFYNEQRFTLNLTRSDMTIAGHSPSVRLFEAAACGTPIISDWWTGLDEIFEPGKEILIASDTEDMLGILKNTSPAEARSIGAAGCAKVLAHHTSAHRARELEGHINEVARYVAHNHA